MIAPPRPENESVRLKRLRALGILDTEPEARFDVVTRLAKQFFGVEIAVVSLVDENRQWFKSCIGLDVSETSREVSFCGHTILQDGIMEIPDASLDERFHDNPLVSGPPHIRFYAGFSLRADGVNVGTLCIIDPTPRTLLAAERRMLADLGALVERELAAMEMAAIDEATGLVNRRGLHVTGNQLVALSRSTSKPVSVLFFDLDGFKQINDTFGHEAGDRALSEFSDSLQKAFRDSDVVARLGGDEFCVLLASAPEAALARPLRRLEEIIEKRNAACPPGHEIRYSVGMASFDPHRHQTFADLLRAADEAMYADKSRNRRPAA